MEKKKIIIAVAICVLLAGSLSLLMRNSKKITNDVKNIKTQEDTVNDVKKPSEEKSKPNLSENSNKAEKQSDSNASSLTKNSVKTSNMYNNIPESMMPLSAISETAGQPQNVKDSVNKLLENSNGIYMVKNTGNKLIVVTDNPSNIRHGIDFVEISLKSGHQIATKLGYSDKMKDSDNDYWEYDKSSENQIPLKHIKYKADGNVDFIETWNYDASNPVKYEMKDSEDRTVSIRKETLDGNSNLRIEHVTYDKDGKTKINVTTTYEGADLKRFTYYNADKPSESASVFSDYQDKYL